MELLVSFSRASSGQRLQKCCFRSFLELPNVHTHTEHTHVHTHAHTLSTLAVREVDSSGSVFIKVDSLVKCLQSCLCMWVCVCLWITWYIESRQTIESNPIVLSDQQCCYLHCLSTVLPGFLTLPLSIAKIKITQRKSFAQIFELWKNKYTTSIPIHSGFPVLLKNTWHITFHSNVGWRITNIGQEYKSRLAKDEVSFSRASL